MLFKKYTIFVGDNETDGPNMHDHSMVWFSAMRLTKELNLTFEGKVRPKSNNWNPNALAVTGLTREETLEFPEPTVVMRKFVDWVKANTKSGTQALYCSDNNGYDWGWLNYYLWHYTGENPFGHTSCNVTNLYQGLMAGREVAGIYDSLEVRTSFNHLISTPHDHSPVNDVRGLGEAMLGMAKYGMVFPT